MLQPLSPSMTTRCLLVRLLLIFLVLHFQQYCTDTWFAGMVPQPSVTTHTSKQDHADSSLLSGESVNLASPNNYYIDLPSEHSCAETGTPHEMTPAGSQVSTLLLEVSKIAPTTSGSKCHKKMKL